MDGLPSGGIVSSVSPDSIVYHCGEILDGPSVRSFSIRTDFGVIGPDDHVFSCHLGYNAAIQQCVYSYARFEYLNAIGVLVHVYEMPLCAGVGPTSLRDCFSVPSQAGKGAVTMRVWLVTSVTGAGAFSANLEMRLAKPRKLLQFGK